MNQDSSDQCAICSQQPEDMLILSCAHNLCLDCATELFTASSDSNSLQCQICLSSTPLDQDTINCLRHLASRETVQVQQVASYPPLPKAGNKKNLWQCTQHSQRSLYYCLECNDFRICSECILAKRHMNHKVMTIKKAGVFLMQKIEANTIQLQAKRSGLKQNEQFLLGLKQKMLNEYEEKQSNLKSMFETIMRNLEFKYSQLKTQMESLSKRSFEMVEGTLNHLRQRHQFINVQIKSSKQVIKSRSQQEILLKCIELQHNKLHTHTNVQELSFSQFHIPPLNLPIHQIIKDFDRIMLKIKWNQQDKNGKCTQHDMFQSAKTEFLQNSNIKRDEVYEDPENLSQGSQNSMYKYSGIKGNSRRLELSRSMDNATNIINKLQERIKR